MSTRCTLTVRDEKDGEEAYSIYRHYDGYPDDKSGVLWTLRKALSYAWELPRFDPAEFAAAIVAAWKMPAKQYTQGGNIYFTKNRDWHGDTSYHYEIYGDGERIAVECFRATYPNGYDDCVWVKEGATHYLTAEMQPDFDIEKVGQRG
jgi:hypothetical protein